MSLCKADFDRNAAAYRPSLKAAKLKGMTPPITYGNATTTGLYSGHSMASPRANADDHRQHASRDSGAMIVRCL